MPTPPNPSRAYVYPAAASYPSLGPGDYEPITRCPGSTPLTLTVTLTVTLTLTLTLRLTLPLTPTLTLTLTHRSLRSLLTTLVLSTPALLNVGLLLALFIYMWSALGMALIGEAA